MDLKDVVSKIDVWEDWRNRYKAFVPKFVAEASNKQNHSDWDKDVFDEYFEKSADQCISSMQQGYFSGVEKERIKQNWLNIAPLLKQIAESQDIPLWDVYDQTKNEILNLTDTNKDAAINRLIAGLQPQLLTTVVVRSRLANLVNLLRSACNLPLQSFQNVNWFKDSNLVLNLFKSALPALDVYDIPTYPWQTLEFLKDNDINFLSMQVENERMIQLLRFKKQIILQGPPGTGKTKLAKELAAEMIEFRAQKSKPSVISDRDIRNCLKPDIKISSASGNASYHITEVLNDRLKSRKSNETVDETLFRNIQLAYEHKRWDSEIGDNPTRRAAAFAKYIYDIIPEFETKAQLEECAEFKIIQFHPSYSYEDFVRGIVAETKGDRIEYKSVNKILGKFATEAKKNWDDCKKDISSVSKEIKVREYFEDFADEMLERMTEGVVVKLTNSVNLVAVEEDAFRYKGNDGWTPLGNRMLFKDIIQSYIDGNSTRQNIKNNKNLSGLAFQHATYFVRVLNLFQNYLDTNNLRFDHLSSDKPELKNYVLVIDEINRANLSSVLGELIYALEYRGEKVESMYEVDGSNKIVLPENLFIIGTMNTADRSVGHIDYAIRRRFAFVNILPVDLSNELKDDFMTECFKQVQDLFYNKEQTHLSEEFEPEQVCLGHSYFIQQFKLDSKGNKTQEKVDFKLRINYEIIPILLEYIKDGVLKDSKVLRDRIEQLKNF